MEAPATWFEAGARLAWLAGLFLGLSGTSGAESGTQGLGLACPLEPGRSTREIKVDGRNRSVVVEVGALAGKSGPAPVVFFWHGWGGAAGALLDGIGASRSWPEAVFIAPEGLRRRFPGLSSRSQPGWQVAPGEHSDRDMAFFDALVADLSRLPCLDTRRFLSTGFSNGGYFSNLLGCERAGVLAGIAPVGGGGPTEACETPVPVWIAHGRGDRVIPLREGRGSFSRWQETNGCKDIEVDRDGCQVARGCKRETVLCTFPGRHTWPMALTRRWQQFLAAQRRAAAPQP
ncbi:MAG: hypothetical protein VX546_08990 [Myxococcota bacterium]|nr:hypothetical protein [Myxococcota bacterium]